MVIIVLIAIALFFLYKSKVFKKLETFLPKSIDTTSVQKLISSDIRLDSLLSKIKSEMKRCPLEYERILQLIDEFFELYMTCFQNREKAIVHVFTMITTYKEILNMNHLIQCITQDTFQLLNENLWKYIQVINFKHDLEEPNPSPFNTVDKQYVY
jgi:hypothetical protein